MIKEKKGASSGNEKTNGAGSKGNSTNPHVYLNPRPRPPGGTVKGKKKALNVERSRAGSVVNQNWHKIFY